MLVDIIGFNKNEPLILLWIKHKFIHLHRSTLIKTGPDALYYNQSYENHDFNTRTLINRKILVKMHKSMRNMRFHEVLMSKFFSFFYVKRRIIIQSVLYSM